MDLFNDCTVFNSDISAWDTSSVTRMDRMFCFCKNFSRDVGSWDTSRVVNMGGQFYDCQKFNQDIGAWDTAAVTNMRDIFVGCAQFNHDLRRWNLSALERGGSDRMFGGAAALNEQFRPTNYQAYLDFSDLESDSEPEEDD